MSQTFEQFVRFTTDAAGLERTLRLFQSIAQILSSYTLPFNCLLLLLAFLPTSTPADAATTQTALLGLRNQLALARRYFRLFRFFESFHAAQKIYLSLSSPSPAPPRSWARRALWLDVFGRTFNGMYLLLEASTMADALKVPGLAPWGPELERTIGVEGQRFWLFSLACGALAGLARIADVLAAAAAADEAVGKAKSDADGEKKEGAATDVDGSDEKSGGKAEGEEQAKKRVDDLARKREVQVKISNLARRALSDALDITLPGSIVGWVPASSGTVGLAMFVTTVLTSIDIWERCGREVAGSKK